jgi:hypothetical protein
MRSIIHLLVSGLLLWPAASSAFPINIDPGGYLGNYVVIGQQFTGPITLDLAPGTYDWDDGNEIAGSALSFNVDNAGQVTSNNPAAAQGIGALLQLANTVITVDPGAYPYGYYPYAGTHTPVSGVQNIVVIPTLTYGVDDGAFLGNSNFLYTVDDNGQVSCSTASASCSATTVALQSTSVAVNTGGYLGSYYLIAGGKTRYSGSQSFTLLKGLVYAIDDGSFLGGSGFSFQVAPDGSVTVISSPAATGGSSLTFSVVSVHIDAGGYPGTYQLATIGPLSGVTDTLVMNGLITNLIIDNGQATTLTPTSGGVTPPTFSFNNGQAYSFGLGLTSGFTPSGGNVPVTSGSVTVTFSSVTSPGSTTVTSSKTAPAPPAGFRLGQVRTFYDVTTTATFAGSIEVCLSYAGLGVTRPTRLKLFHYQGGAWVNVTTSNDTVNQVICGTVTSLSPFGIFDQIGNGNGKGDGDDDDHGHDRDQDHDRDHGRDR